MARNLKVKGLTTASKGEARALHADIDGAHHVVGFGNLRVVIVADEGSWFAQGLDIDYAAQGETIEEAKENFSRGLRATINQHLCSHSNIRNLLKGADPETCRHLLLDSSFGTAQLKFFSQVSAHHIHQAIPFSHIAYLVQQEQECAI
jgi:predicted RNase H-like HicB family nuclease